MAVGYEYEFDDTNIADLKDGRARRRVKKEVSLAIRSGLRAMQSYHKRHAIKRGGGKPTKHKWVTRTGEAARSFHIDWRPGALKGSYWSDLKRIKMLEEGGTIKSKRAGGYLAIPTDAAKHGVGPSGSPRDYPGLVFIQSLRGQPLLVRPDNSAGGFTTMFILRKRVVLPPRPTLARTMKKKAPVVETKIADAVEKGIGNGPR